jgi:hypothetical protein
MSALQITASNFHGPRQLWKEFQLFSWPPSSEMLALGGLGSANIARPGEGESRLRGFCNTYHSGAQKFQGFIFKPTSLSILQRNDQRSSA